MEQSVLMDALVLAKRMGNLLDEVMDVSRQMAEALDRGDRVVIQMLLGMRAEPLERLKQTDKALRGMKVGLSAKDAERLIGLLNGTQEPKDREEELLVRQMESNRRTHKGVLELDEVLNRKLTHDKSVYQ